MTPNPSRRRVLQLTGVGATASIAGCAQLDDIASDDDGDANGESNGNDELDVGTEPDIDPADGITAIVQPSQAELEEVQQEVMAEVEDGDISQEEAQLEIQDRQMELVASSAAAFESSVADDDDLTVEAGIGEQGALLISASDERLIDTLRNDEVTGLVPGEEYAEILELQQQPAPDAEGIEGEEIEDE